MTFPDPALDHRTSPRHEHFMNVALALGRRALGNAWPNPAVGAALVRNEDGVPIVVGRGWTQPGGRPHAETEALRRAGAAARGATLYVTLEPCSHHGKTPPCADTIIAAGVTRVVSALEDPNPEVAGRGHARLRAHGIRVDVGLGAEEAALAHAGHITRIRFGRPHVTLKLAISVDGKVALAGRIPTAISGPAARDFVHLMRAQNDAIMVGIGTVMSDDPLLTCRLPGMEKRSPVRVVLDPRLRLPLTSALAKTANAIRTWIIAGPDAPRAAEQALQGRGLMVFRGDARDGRLDLATALGMLAAEGITRVMVEGGPRIAAALVSADLVDEAVLLRSSQSIGIDGIDALEHLPLTALTQSMRLKSHSSETIGEDIVETYERT